MCSRSRARAAWVAPAATWALAWFLFLLPGRAYPAQVPAVEEPSAALILFQSYRGRLPLALSPTRMRYLASETLTRLFEERGIGVADYLKVESIQRDWRIRADNNLNPEFLQALATELSVDRVLVANLVIYPDRLILLIRGVEAPGGWLVWAEVGEEFSGDLQGEPLEALRNWKDVVERVGRRVVGDFWERRARPDAETLVLLPMVPVGVGQGQLDAAGQCLLRSLLGVERWRVPDPALVGSALQREGYDLKRLDRGVRRELITRYGAEILLLSRVVSFGGAQAVTGPVLADEDYEDVSLLLREARIPIYAALFVVDCDSGRIQTADALYLEPVDPLGIFGIVKEVRIVDRLKKATDSLVGILPVEEGDS